MTINYQSPVIDNESTSPDLDSLKSGSDKLNDALEQIKQRLTSVSSILRTFETDSDDITISLENEGWLFVTTSDLPVTVTLPLIDDPTTGQMVHFIQLGTGEITFVAGTGANVYTALNNTSRAQFSFTTAIRVFEDGWSLNGDLNGLVTDIIPDLAVLIDGGDARGENSINLQTVRTLPENVASGDNAISIGRGRASSHKAINIGFGGVSEGDNEPLSIGSGSANSTGTAFMAQTVNIGRGGAEGENVVNIGAGGAYYDVIGETYNIGPGGAYGDNAFNIGSGGAYGGNTFNIGSGGSTADRSINIGTGGAYEINSISIGDGLVGENAVSVGWGTEAAGINSLALAGGTATMDDAVAFGPDAFAIHSYSVAFPRTTTTAESQVNVGDRDLVMEKLGSALQFRDTNSVDYRLTVQDGHMRLNDSIPSELIYAIPDADIADINANNGTIQLWSPDRQSTVIDNLVSGSNVTLIITAAEYIFWPDMYWLSGSEPVLSPDGQTVVELFKVGNSLYGSHVGSPTLVSEFTIDSLFANGEQGAWYDPIDLNTMFQDSVGTVPVEFDTDPVGLITDKSGNSNHAEQSISASRMTYREIDREYFLESDTVDDNMTMLLPDNTYNVFHATFSGVVEYEINVTGGTGAPFYGLASSPTTNNVLGLVTVDTTVDSAKIRDYYEKRGAGQNLTGVTSINNWFADRNDVTKIYSGEWDTSSVTNIGSFVSNCSNLTALDVSSWDTSSVTRSENFAKNASVIPTLDVSNWITSSVTDFTHFVSGCSNLTALDVSLWDTSSVVSFSLFAFQCPNLTTLDVSNWVTSSTTHFNGFVYNCASLTTLDVSSWDTSSVIDFNGFAFGCSNLTTLDVSNWDTSNVTDFQNFVRASGISTVTVNGGTGNPFADSPCIEYPDAFTDTNLDQQSIDDILVAIEQAGTSSGTFDQSGGSVPSLTGETAIDALRARSWTITVTGGY